MKRKDRNPGSPHWAASRHSVFSILVLLLLLHVRGPAQTATISVVPDADSFVRSLAPINNYGAGGALSVSGVAAVNSLGEQNGLFDTVIRFAASNVIASLENDLGGPDWMVTTATLVSTEMVALDNAIFNPGVGALEARWLFPNLEFSIVGQGLWDEQTPGVRAGGNAPGDSAQRLRKGRMALLEAEANGSQWRVRGINLRFRKPEFNIQGIPANDEPGEPRLYHARRFFGRQGQQLNRKLDPEAWRCLLMPSLFLSTSAGGAEITRAAQVKAVFLFNFTQFTEWPPEAFVDRDAPFVIGILGNDPFGPFLDETVQNETVRGRQIKVERYRTVTELKNCHILYLGLSTPDGVQRALKAIKGKPVMSVSDNDESARPIEATINFLTKQNKIRFAINLGAAREARLSLSSKLLRAAEEVISSDRK